MTLPDVLRDGEGILTTWSHHFLPFPVPSACVFYANGEAKEGANMSWLWLRTHALMVVSTLGSGARGGGGGVTMTITQRKKWVCSASFSWLTSLSYTS